jgi:hypothetical protein
MMNKHIRVSRTENGSFCNVGMEQAALLKARIAIARIRQLEEVILSEGRAHSAKECWFAALEDGLCDWIARGGFAQEDGDGSRELTAESTYID